MNVANFLTILRLSSPLFFIIICLVVEEKNTESLCILLCFVFMSITDYFDGLIARKYNQISLFGKVFDPISDKILVSSALLYILSFDSNILLPSIIIIFREFLVSGIREFSTSKSKIHIDVAYISKIKTCLQFISIASFLSNNLLQSLYALNVYNYALYGIWIATILTLYTGLKYASTIVIK